MKQQVGFMRTIRDKNKRPNNFLILRQDPNHHQIVTGKDGKAVWAHQIGMMSWTADGSCGWLCVYVIAIVCVHVVNCGSLHPHLRVCVREREPETVTVVEMHSCAVQLHYSHDPEFLLDYQQMEISGESAAAAQISSMPLPSPCSWLHVAASSVHFMMLSVWHQLKSVEACGVIRADWNQLLTSESKSKNTAKQLI